MFQQPRGTDIPRIGNDEGLVTRMQRAKCEAFLSLRQHKLPRERGRKAECTIDYPRKISFFAQNKVFTLCHSKILSRFCVRLQPRTIGFIRRQAVERNQAPGYVVGAFMGKKISDKMAAATGNNAAPVLGVLFKRIRLEGINLIADDAGHSHRRSPDVRCMANTLPIALSAYFV